MGEAGALRLEVGITQAAAVGQLDEAGAGIIGKPCPNDVVEIAALVPLFTVD